VLKGLISEPLKTLFFAIILSIILYYTLGNWATKPLFLRLAFFILFPLQICLYFLFGTSFETRLFAESTPLITVLIAYQPGDHDTAQKTTSGLT